MRMRTAVLVSCIPPTVGIRTSNSFLGGPWSLLSPLYGSSMGVLWGFFGKSTHQSNGETSEKNCDIA